MLVGLQKERTAAPLAGLKTFGLASLMGALAASITPATGSWIVGAGLLAIVGVLAIGNAIQMRRQDASPGQTTEVAMLVMYLVGALTVFGPRSVAIVLGGAVAVLLHLRQELKGVVTRMSDRDVRAIMQFVLVWLVILPIVPNRTIGPFDVLNPHNIWLMVVLIVGLNLAGYVAFRLLSARGGVAVAGLLGGAVSSTATTAAYARSSREGGIPDRAAALVVWLASGVVYVRILIEVAAVAPGFLPDVAGPALVLLGIFAGTAALTWHQAPPREDGALDPGNPTRLRSAILFGILYAAVLLAVAAAEAYLGDAGLYATAVVSGLTDVDAITLSTARLVAEGRVAESMGWRIIVVASLSNLVFKLGIAWALGGAALGRRIASMTMPALAGGLALVWLWG